MANQLYEYYANQLLTDGADIVNLGTPSGAIKTSLLTTTYTRSNTHTHENHLTNQVGGLATAANPVVNNTSGDVNFDADPATHGTVAAGSDVGYVALLHDTGTPTTSVLIAFYDTDQGGPISLTTNNGDIVIEWGTSIIDLV